MAGIVPVSLGKRQNARIKAPSAHSFRAFRPWLCGPVALSVWQVALQGLAEGGLGERPADR